MTNSSENENVDNSINSKRPPDSAFKQQRLPAWQPQLTANTVLPIFFIIGILFIPIGVVLLYFSDGVYERIIDYTNCLDASQPNDNNITCASVIANDPRAECKCQIQFTLDCDFVGEVYMYYGLGNYYQNHRRYAKSRDDNQLLGRLSLDQSLTHCYPFHESSEGQPIAPCGAIANSLFNDTLQIRCMSAESQYVPLLNRGIAWPSDRNIKFRNPEGNLTQALQGFSKPIAWSKNLWELDPDPDNNGFQNEDLIVWMRTAALPTFRKFYRRIDHSNLLFAQGLPQGNYTLEVNYRYPVSAFHGSKQMIVSTTSIFGGKNSFLGFAYIAVASICLLLGVILLFIHIKYSTHFIDIIIVDRNTEYT